MFFSWLKRRRRRRLVAGPFPADWLEYLKRNVGHYRYLTDGERAALRDRLRVFVAEKHWEGCGGLELTDEIKVTIAAQACLLVLGFDEEYYDHVLSILVYPGDYLVPTEHRDAMGIVTEGHSHRSGEAWHRGPVILSWEDARDCDAHDGQNLVLHEFAHQLDMKNGPPNGTPPLRGRQRRRRWAAVMQREFQRHRRRVRHGEPTLLDPYGATDEAEFFAVATEAFFEQPVELEREHTDLYGVLADYYRQNPAGRMRAAGAD